MSDTTVRPAAPPATNAVRMAGSQAAAVGVGTYVSALICQNFEVSLEQSIAIVMVGGAVLGWFSGFFGSIARNWLHEDGLLPSERQMGPGAKALLQAIGSMLGVLLLAFLLSACAAARMAPDGTVSAWALGQAKVERCALVDGQQICIQVAGGPLSEGLLSAIGGVLRAILPAGLQGGS